MSSNFYFKSINRRLLAFLFFSMLLLFFIILMLSNFEGRYSKLFLVIFLLLCIVFYYFYLSCSIFSLSHVLIDYVFTIFSSFDSEFLRTHRTWKCTPLPSFPSPAQAHRLAQRTDLAVAHVHHHNRNAPAKTTRICHPRKPSGP